MIVHQLKTNIEKKTVPTISQISSKYYTAHPHTTLQVVPPLIGVIPPAYPYMMYPYRNGLDLPNLHFFPVPQ